MVCSIYWTITFNGPFKYLVIGISTSAPALAAATALQKFYFCLTNFFFIEIELLRPEHLNILSLFGYLASGSFCYNYLLLYDFGSIYQEASIGVRKKRLLGIFGSTRLFVFWKNSCSKTFWKLPNKKIYGGDLRKYTHRPSWEFSKKLYIAADP